MLNGSVFRSCRSSAGEGLDSNDTQFVGVRGCPQTTGNAVLNCVGGTPPDTHGCRKRHWGSNGRRFKSCQPDESKQALTRDDAIVTLLNESKLGTIWGPQVPGEQFSGVGEGLPVGV